jgi:Ca2+-binding EF-hand superfamily protein
MGHKMTSMMGGTKDLDNAFAEMDPNGDGSIAFDEFLGWYKKKHPESLDDVNAQIKSIFDSIDESGTGALTKTEVGKVMGRLHLKTGGSIFHSHKKLDKAFKAMDPSGNGTVTFDEFVHWYHNRDSDSTAAPSLNVAPVSIQSMKEMDSKIRSLFASADKDHNGSLNMKEVGKLMSNLGLKTGSGMFHRNNLRDKAFHEMDAGGKGSVTYDDFVRWYHIQKGVHSSSVSTPITPPPGTLKNVSESFPLPPPTTILPSEGGGPPGFG